MEEDKMNNLKNTSIIQKLFVKMDENFVCLFISYQDRCRKRQSIVTFGRWKFRGYCSFKHKFIIRELRENLVDELDDVKANLKVLEKEMKREMI